MIALRVGGVVLVVVLCAMVCRSAPADQRRWITACFFAGAWVVAMVHMWRNR